MDIGKFLSGLYASEIHGGIAWLYDGGFDWWVGSIEFENAPARGGEETVEEAAQAMHDAALRLFPDSEYARKAAVEREGPSTLIQRIKEVRAKTGCGLNEAVEACKANATVEDAIRAIRQSAEACGLATSRLATPSACELTPEMLEAVKEALEKLTTCDEDGGMFYSVNEMVHAGAKLRAAFGIEEG